VEERLSPDRDVERYIRVGLVAAGVEAPVLLGRDSHQVPLYAPVEVVYVYATFNGVGVVGAGHLEDMLKVDLRDREGKRGIEREREG